MHFYIIFLTKWWEWWNFRSQKNVEGSFFFNELFFFTFSSPSQFPPQSYFPTICKYFGFHFFRLHYSISIQSEIVPFLWFISGSVFFSFCRLEPTLAASERNKNMRNVERGKFNKKLINKAIIHKRCSFFSLKSQNGCWMWASDEALKGRRSREQSWKMLKEITGNGSHSEWQTLVHSECGAWNGVQCSKYTVMMFAMTFNNFNVQEPYWYWHNASIQCTLRTKYEHWTKKKKN